jgi:2'-5' RNA ligase
MMRLFIAVPTPTSVLPLLTQAQDELRASRADIACESMEKLHCTIKFLGDTQEELAQPITEALKAIALAARPFTVQYKGLGCFPNRRDPRVVWAGMEDPLSELRTLFTEIDGAMAHYGFERERRAFHPHVTLGRVRSPRRITELLATMETITLESPPVTVHQLELVKSTLQPSGSVYSLIAAMKLGRD